MAILYNIQAIKDDLGETGTTNDKRIRRSGEKAQAEFERQTANVRGIDDVLTTPTNKEKELVNTGAIANFYFIENGDDTAVRRYEDELIPRYIKSRFGRPNFKARGAF